MKRTAILITAAVLWATPPLAARAGTDRASVGTLALGLHPGAFAAIGFNDPHGKGPRDARGDRR